MSLQSWYLKSFFKFLLLVKNSPNTNNVLIIPVKKLLEVKEWPQILFRLQKTEKMNDLTPKFRIGNEYDIYPD